MVNFDASIPTSIPDCFHASRLPSKPSFSNIISISLICSGVMTFFFPSVLFLAVSFLSLRGLLNFKILRSIACSTRNTVCAENVFVEAFDSFFLEEINGALDSSLNRSSFLTEADDMKEGGLWQESTNYYEGSLSHLDVFHFFIRLVPFHVTKKQTESWKTLDDPETMTVNSIQGMLHIPSTHLPSS